MKPSLLAALSVAALALGACSSTPEITSVTANPTTVAAGGTIQMTVAVDGVELGEHAEALTARGLRVAHGDETEIHLHTYLDNTDSNPLVQTSSASYPVVIPQATAAGAHTLIVRLHNGDHTIYDPEVKATVDITVQ